MPSQPKPSKLFSLKEWLTLDESAKHLSIAFGEEVTRADVLRLAIDKRLTLSVNFVNHATVRKGALVPLEECTFRVYQRLEKASKDRALIMRKGILHSELNELGPEIEQALMDDAAFLLPEAIGYRPGEFLTQEDKISTISGVWDLPLLGGELLDVEHLYQMETDGPAVTLTNLDGAFVERDGVVCQLQDDYEHNEYYAGSKAAGDRLEGMIDQQKTPKKEAAELRARYAEQRKGFLERRKNDARERRYYPSSGLPGDAVYVVRTSALRTLEQALLDAAMPARPISRREETTMLNITAGLLGLLVGETPAGKRQSVFKNQAAVIDALLAAHEGRPGISKRTLEEKFAQAKKSLES